MSLEFPVEINSKTQLYNIPASLNGNKLKGRDKTIYFILALNKGKHTIKFFPKDSAIKDQK